MYTEAEMEQRKNREYMWWQWRLSTYTAMLDVHSCYITS